MAISTINIQAFPEIGVSYQRARTVVVGKIIKKHSILNKTEYIFDLDNPLFVQEWWR